MRNAQLFTKSICESSNRAFSLPNAETTLNDNKINLMVYQRFRWLVGMHCDEYVFIDEYFVFSYIFFLCSIFSVVA